MTTYKPLPFEKTGLPQTAEVKKAYELVKDNPRAVGAARILAGMGLDEKPVTALLVSFVEPRMTQKEMKKEFNADLGYAFDKTIVAEDVAKLHAIRDGEVTSPAGLLVKTEYQTYSKYSSNVEACHIACVIYDAETQLAESRDTPLSQSFMAAARTGDKTVISFGRLEDTVRAVHRQLEDYLPYAEHYTMMDGVTQRLRQALQAYEMRLALGDAPAAAAPAVRKAPRGRKPS